MYIRYALLAILLIQTLSASVVGARGSAITGRASLRADTTYPYLPVKSQRVLLHVLEQNSLTRVGGRASIPIDVRVVAATNTDLTRAVQEGTFREDLYYRLNTVPLLLPPLRDHREDIPLLVAHFVRHCPV